MKKFRSTVWFMGTRNGSPADTGAFLDMLRYDNARVVDWTYVDNMYFQVTLETNQPATVGRWNSFGIRIESEQR